MYSGSGGTHVRIASSTLSFQASRLPGDPRGDHFTMLLATSRSSLIVGLEVAGEICAADGTATVGDEVNGDLVCPDVSMTLRRVYVSVPNTNGPRTSGRHYA